jgi:hypothetical protein
VVSELVSPETSAGVSVDVGVSAVFTVADVAGLLVVADCVTLATLAGVAFVPAIAQPPTAQTNADAAATNTSASLRVLFKIRHLPRVSYHRE